MIFRKPKKKERTVPMKVPNNSFFLVDKLRVRKNKVVTEYKGKQTSNMFFYAYRLPTTLPFGWLPLVLDSVDECYEILLDFNPLDVNETIQAQDARIRNLSIDIKAIELSGKTPPQSMVESLNEARSVHRAIVMGEEKPFNIFPYGRIYQERERGESNPEKVKKFLGVLTGAINGFGFYTKKATSKTLRRIARKSFILPSLDILDDRLALSSYVVNMFPFGCSTLPSDINLDGIFVGPVLPSGQPCIIDIEETGEGKNFNNNITIIGCPGAGKSVFVGTLACRANDRGIGVLIIDCQAEYLDVVSSRGGVVLTFGYQRDAQEHVFINLLDPFDIPLPERIRQLLMLLSRIFELTQPQESFLREAIKEVYERKGIFINDPESWKKKPPTMSDLLQVINRRREEAAEEKDVVSKNILDSLYIRIRELTKDGAYPFFDGESTFQVEYLREKLVCINLKPLASEFARRLVGLAVLQIANSHLGKIKRHWRIAIDEGWIFLKTEEILREILKTGRKYNCGLWIATQDLEDIGGSAATLLADSATKILLRTDETAIDQVARKFKLPSYLAELATKLKVGEALIKLSSLPTWLRVYVEPEIIPKARFERRTRSRGLKPRSRSTIRSLRKK